MCKDPGGRAAKLDPPVLFPDHPPTDRRQETAAPRRDVRVEPEGRRRWVSRSRRWSSLGSNSRAARLFERPLLPYIPLIVVVSYWGFSVA